MEIRRYRESDRPQLVALWKRAFPDDPPRNEPDRMIDAKLAVDGLIFVADAAGGIIGAAIEGLRRPPRLALLGCRRRFDA